MVVGMLWLDPDGRPSSGASQRRCRDLGRLHRAAHFALTQPRIQFKAALAGAAKPAWTSRAASFPPRAQCASHAPAGTPQHPAAPVSGWFRPHLADLSQPAYHLVESDRHSMVRVPGLVRRHILDRASLSVPQRQRVGQSSCADFAAARRTDGDCVVRLPPRDSTADQTRLGFYSNSHYRRPDPYNNDLFASTVTLPPAPQPVAGWDVGPPPSPTGVPANDARDRKLRGYRVNAAGSELKLVRGEFHRHSEISKDGALTARSRPMALHSGCGALDWVGCCDHDNGGGREYSWWTTQKLTDIFYTPGKFAPMFSYERSVQYPGRAPQRLVRSARHRPLPRLPITSGDVRARSRHANVVRIPETVRRRDGLAHQRHGHGDGLA